MLDVKVIINRFDATWTVFLHGFGGSSDTWKNQISAFGDRYNLLLINFHIHKETTDRLSIKHVCSEINETMSYYGTGCANIVSLSSGSLVALAFAALYPERVLSMIMAGGMLSFNFRTHLLIAAAITFQNIIPYMSLYKIFAYIIMPRQNHIRSRAIFVREAEKLGHHEFCRWVNLIPALINNRSYIKMINSSSHEINFLYVMGSQDHLFVKAVSKEAKDLKNASVKIIDNCGHVCTIEKADDFNRISLVYLIKHDPKV
ncbi:MAG: alpha/beta hydrolase [Clostridia bacterium]|jgi:pimeloyl-ACP methyl ester carboxylesterase